MAEKSFRVVDENGYIGTLRAPARFLDSRTEKTIDLETGEQIVVPADQLRPQQDGSFLLLRRPSSNAHGSSRLQDVGVGGLTASPPERPGEQPTDRIALDPSTDDGLEPPSQSFYSDDYDIERVHIGKVIEARAESRQEGETLILPVVEEVLVYQKKLLLKEEVRITRRRKPVGQVRRIEDTGNA